MNVTPMFDNGPFAPTRQSHSPWGGVQAVLIAAARQSPAEVGWRVIVGRRPLCHTFATHCLGSATDMTTVEHRLDRRGGPGFPATLLIMTLSADNVSP